MEKDIVQALLRGDLPVWRLKGAALPAFGGALDEALDTASWRAYRGAPAGAGIDKVGPAQCEYGGDDRAAYFAAATACRATFAPGTPVGELWADLATALGASVAQDATFGRHQPAVLHRLKGASMLLHCDFAPQDARGWPLEAVTEQLACVVHLRGTGGATEVFEKAWEPSDESFRVRDSYHYDEAVVAGVASHRLDFLPGDVAIFNSRHFHRVHAAAQDRYSLNAFVGKQHNRQLVMWA